MTIRDIYKLPPLPTLWYENAKGDRWIPTIYDQEPPDGFPYQWSRFPSVLEERCYRNVVPDEVQACKHPQKYIKHTGGWVEGTQGRECTRCNGTQTRREGACWPKEWEAHGAREFVTGRMGWSEDLVLAMVAPPWHLRLLGRKPIPLGQAILIAATACERCTNALAFHYRLGWGYPEGSEEWIKASTHCHLCEGDQP